MNKLIVLCLFILMSCTTQKNSNSRDEENDGPFCNTNLREYAPTVVESGSVYHGSSVGFVGIPRASYSTRFENGNEKPVWADTAVFATSDYRIALSYTAVADIQGYAAGVELNIKKLPHEPVLLAVTGGKNLQQALDVLFGPEDNCHTFFRPGHLYLLNANAFSWEKGIGVMELVGRKKIKLKKHFEINRRQEINVLVEKGLLKLLWVKDIKDEKYKSVWWKRNW